MSLVQSLDNLVGTLEKKGISIKSRLRPGLTRLDVQAVLSPLGLRPPEELYMLYEWHNGVDDPLSAPVMLFGEHQFLSLDNAIQEYREMVNHYSSVNIDVTRCFPFASFQADSCAIYCENTSIDGLLYPIINFYHGISIFYESIDSMAQTATEWFASGIYNSELVDDVLHAAIRDRINPNIPHRSTTL